MQKTASAFATVTFAVGLGASAVFAQSTGPVQAPSATLPSPSAQLAFPGTFGVPSAVAPRSGSAFVGATYATPRGGVSGAGGDGDLVAGYSIGNPLDAVSLTIGLALTGTNPLGDAGAFSLTASRLLQAGGNTATFFGVSASNLLPWGVNARRSEQYSGYVSHLVGVKAGSVEIPLQFVLGYGTDNTRDSAGAGLLSDGVFAGFGSWREREYKRQRLGDAHASECRNVVCVTAHRPQRNLWGDGCHRQHGPSASQLLGRLRLLMTKMRMRTMMKFVLVAALTLASANVASAGDTIIINMPGGPTQTVSTSMVAAAIHRADSTAGLLGRTGTGAVTSVTQNAATGYFTVTTAGGQTYTVSSRFITTLLSYYK